MNINRQAMKSRLKRLSRMSRHSGKLARFRHIQTPQQIARQKQNDRAASSRKLNRQRGK